MTTALPPATVRPAYSTSTPAPAPVAEAHSYLCSDCVLSVKATEVHDLGGGDVVAYCDRCARVYRRYAVNTYAAWRAHRLGIKVTL